MLIDTHCHLDAAEFDADREAVIRNAREAGVSGIVIPSVERANFAVVRDLAHAFTGGAYALGIHPMYVSRAVESDLDYLREQVRVAMDDPRFVAVGEIGLDFFAAGPPQGKNGPLGGQQAAQPRGVGAFPLPGIVQGEQRERQEYFYAAQLDIAAEFDLPVLLHVRRSQDTLLKYLRRKPGVPGGIAHAFNGSAQQAQAFVERGFALGLGGAMTYARALQIRRHAVDMSLEHLVLETDAPDIPPAWLRELERRNAPRELARIADTLAELRGMRSEDIAHATTRNACRVLPRLRALI